MIYRGLKIDDTFAEAFNMKASRIIVTADNKKWAKNACISFTGFATSVIACGIEAGIEKELNSNMTPDGRPGYSILLFSMLRSQLEKQLETRVGQCLLTCPTTAVFSGMESEDIIPLGKNFLIDRGDLSKEIETYMVPRYQRWITKKVKDKGKNIFIATNFLESMVNHPYPNRGEANDIYSCLEMGVDGLVLAGETAIGNYPAECVLFIKKLIKSFPNK